MKLLPFSTLLLGFTIFFFSNTFAQTQFIDATETHLPSAPDLHSLGSDFVDVDKDGDLDIAIAVEYGANRLYINDGNGKFSWKKGAFGEASHDTEHVAGADFNRDGHVDFIFIAEDDQAHQLFFGNSDGSFTDETYRLPSMSEGNALAVGDLNGDDLPDIVVGNTGEENQNFLWLNNPDQPGHFIDQTQDRLPAVQNNTQSIALTDIDKDGDLDMVLGNETPPNALYLNDGNGTFSDHSDRLELLTPLETREVHVRDFTGDKHLDILFFNLTSNNSGWDKKPRTRLLVNNGQGFFMDETTERLPYNSFSVYAGIPVDLNQDGALDIVFGPIQIPGFVPLQIRAYINDGSGYFSDETENYIPATTTGRGWGFEVGDLNGDGNNDIFIGGWRTQARLLLAK